MAQSRGELLRPSPPAMPSGKQLWRRFYTGASLQSVPSTANMSIKYASPSAD